MVFPGVLGISGFSLLRFKRCSNNAHFLRPGQNGDVALTSVQIEESRVEGLGFRVEQSAQSVPITADGFGAHY